MCPDNHKAYNKRKNKHIFSLTQKHIAEKKETERKIKTEKQHEEETQAFELKKRLFYIFT